MHDTAVQQFAYDILQEVSHYPVGDQFSKEDIEKAKRAVYKILKAYRKEIVVELKKYIGCLEDD